MNDHAKGYVGSRILKLQVGFLLSESGGYSRDIEFDVPALKVADDLTLDYLRGTLHLSRTSRGVLVQGKLKTRLPAQCGRCLTDTTVELTVPLEELYVSPPEPDVEYTVGEDGILDLAPLVREETILVTPFNVLCKPDCAGLCLTCGQNLNDGPCDCDKEAIDPRLAVLRDLKNQLSKN